MSPGSRRDEIRESGSRSATATFSTQATLSERRKDARGYYRYFLLVGRMICPPGLQSEPAASASPKSTSTDRASSTTLFVGPGSGRLRTRRSRPPSVAACPGARLPPAVSDNDRLLSTASRAATVSSGIMPPQLTAAGGLEISRSRSVAFPLAWPGAGAFPRGESSSTPGPGSCARSGRRRL